jgi:ABC-type lipoprotein export system ATPase subunit
VWQSLTGDPELILADDPAAGLDPESHTAVSNQLLDAARAGAIVIIASSDPELIDKFTRVITFANFVTGDIVLKSRPS